MILFLEERVWGFYIGLNMEVYCVEYRIFYFFGY